MMMATFRPLSSLVRVFSPMARFSPMELRMNGWMNSHTVPKHRPQEGTVVMVQENLKRTIWPHDVGIEAGSIAIVEGYRTGRLQGLQEDRCFIRSLQTYKMYGMKMDDLWKLIELDQPKA